MSLRVLVVDDTITYRTIVTKAIEALPDVEVVGSANTGGVALSKIERLQPDVVTLDLEMPDMNGIEVLHQIRQRQLKCTVVMVSAFTERGSSLTIEALEAGAFDFVTKSGTGTPAEQLAQLRAALQPILATVQRRLPPPATAVRKVAPPPPTIAPAPPPAVFPKSNRRIPKLRMLLIGVSTGGPNALAQLIPALPADLGLPIFIVQHMPPLFTAQLAKSLDRNAALSVVEATHEAIATPNCVYIAPGGRHLKLERLPDARIRLRVTDDPPENNCRPAVDVLFRSASFAFPGEAAAVILTGMGADGTRGLRLLKRHGCPAIGQDAASSVVYGMPKEAFDAGLIDWQLPLDAIPAALARLAKGLPPISTAAC